MTTRHFLSYLPSLNVSKVHKKVAKKTDCESLTAAAMLTIKERHQMRTELLQCQEVFRAQTRRVFQQLSEDNKKRSNNAAVYKNMSQVERCGICPSYK